MKHPASEPPAYRGAAFAADLCITITILVSFIPVLGFTAWIIAGPMLFASFVLSIVVMSKGGALSGVARLIASIFIAPAIVLCAPFISTVLFGQATKAYASAENAQHEEMPPATPIPAATPKVYRTADEAKLAAVKLYPQLSVAGSRFNLRFNELYRGYKASKPEFFDAPDWPLRLAKQIDESGK